jgi:osmotically-inducible protein OsmY
LICCFHRHVFITVPFSFYHNFPHLNLLPMAENNRNRGSYRTSNQDWNENRGRGNSRNWDDDRNYGQSENRGYGNTGSRDYDDSGSAGWQSRYQREEYNRGGGYSTGRQGRHMASDFDSGNYAGDRDYGYASNYGSGESSYGTGMGSGMGSSGSYGSGSSGSRGDEGMGRRGYSNSGSRMGGSNYGGGYSERGMSDYEGRESSESRNRDYNEGRGSGYTGYAGSGYYGSPGYGGYSGSYRNTGRTWDRDRNQGDRGFWDRASDEVASWFGDDEAERRRDRDRQMNNRGRGPRNYSRSDDRIKEDINDRLSDDPFVDASDIDVTVSTGEVTLTGTVDDRSNKRRAEDLAEAVSGVKNVENRIRVTQNTFSSSTTGTGVTGTRTTGTTSMQNRESQSSDYRSTEKEKDKDKSTGTNSKKDFVTG